VREGGGGEQGVNAVGEEQGQAMRVACASGKRNGGEGSVTCIMMACSERAGGRR
jgi:hypothetical protein